MSCLFLLYPLSPTLQSSLPQITLWPLKIEGSIPPLRHSNLESPIWSKTPMLLLFHIQDENSNRGLGNRSFPFLCFTAGKITTHPRGQGTQHPT